MNDKAKRSPDLIREYFDLLKWKKDGGIVNPIEERAVYVKSSEELSLFVENSIALSSKCIEIHRKSEKDVKDQLNALDMRIFSIKSDLQSLQIKIQRIEKKLLQINQKLDELNLRLSSMPELSTVSTTPRLSQKEYFAAFTAEAVKDFNTFVSKISRVAGRVINQLSGNRDSSIIGIFIVIVLSLIIGTVFHERFRWITLLFIIILLLLYTRRKLGLIGKRHEQAYRQHRVKIKIASEKNELEAEETRLGYERQALEESSQALGSEQSDVESSRQGLLLRLRWIQACIVIEEPG